MTEAAPSIVQKFKERYISLGSANVTLTDLVKKKKPVSYKNDTQFDVEGYAKSGTTRQDTGLGAPKNPSTPLTRNTTCHEYLALDSLGTIKKLSEEDMAVRLSQLELQTITKTEELLGGLPAAYQFPTTQKLPSFWFWFARIITGYISVLVYIFFVVLGFFLDLFSKSLESATDFLIEFFTTPFPLFAFALMPLYWAILKACQKAGIDRIFDPEFIPGYALRRDLGVLRCLKKDKTIIDIPFSELEAHSTTVWDGGNRTMCKLFLKHRDSGEGLLYGAPHKPGYYVAVLWEFFQHFMDTSRPLPDVPELEPYRHLDPTTIEWDKNHKRPARFWRDMSQEEYMDLVDASLEAAETYPFLSPKNSKFKDWKPAGTGEHWYQLG